MDSTDPCQSRRMQQVFTYSKSTIKTVEQGQEFSKLIVSGVFIVNFEQISNLVLLFLFLALNM